MSDYHQGYQDGKAAGTWVIDGNTSRETCESILRGIEQGDPMILDMYEPTYNPNKSEEWQCGMQDGFWDEVERAARYQVEE